MRIKTQILILFISVPLFGSGFFSSAIAATPNEGSFVFSNGDEVFYSYENGNVLEMTLDQETQSLIIKVVAYGDGTLWFSIPRSILDAKSGSMDDTLFVLINGEEVTFAEDSTFSHRNIGITMLRSDTEVQIIGTQVLDTSQFAPTTGSTRDYYVYPLPEWADYAENVIDDAIMAWEDANSNLDFRKVSSPEEADFSIAWVKDFGGLHVGYALGSQYMEVGLGDSFCDGSWRPYYEDYITYIATHEIGHILGLEHSLDPNDIMYDTAPPAQYKVETYEFDSTAGYIHFLRVCSGLDVTSYDFSIDIDDPNGIDVYFVPSINEYDTYGISETFNYYSTKGCFGKNVVKFSGSCSGVSNKGGLLVVLPDKTNKGLVRISASLEENPGTGIINQQEKSKEQTGSDFGSQAGFIGFASVGTDRSSYNYGETITVSGKLSQPDRGARVNVLVTDPLSQTVSQSRLVTTSNGEFQTVTTIPYFHPEGQYTISIYNDKGTFLGDAKFTVKSALTTTQDDVTPELPSYGKIVNLNKYDNDEFGFSVGYPQGWDVDDSYVEPVTNPGFFELASFPVAFYNEIDEWEAYFQVKFTVNDKAAISYRGSQYLDELTDILREDCKLLTLEIDGFTCSNHSIVNSKIIEINGQTAYQVTDSSISTYPNGEYYLDTRVLTDIPVGNDVWTIDATVETSEFPKYANAIYSSINSFIIWESGIKPTPVHDDVPPLITAPSDMVVDADDQYGAIVDYSVKAIDDVNGAVSVFCSPSPSSYFLIEKTTVFCNAQDLSGNKIEKSFTVTVGTKPDNFEVVSNVEEEGEIVTETKTVEASSEPDSSVCGTGTVMKDGKCVAVETPSGGGCLIATAAFGSELAPQVQMLREIRDNTLLHTQSGTSFMSAFNSFYYTFSPTVANWERQNPIFKEMVKATITPLITTLSILNYLDIDSEAEMLVYGISIILMNIGIYFVAPVFVIMKIRRIST